MITTAAEAYFRKFPIVARSSVVNIVMHFASLVVGYLSLADLAAVTVFT